MSGQEQQPPASGSSPFEAPDKPELRTHRFRDIGDGVWERWIWEPAEQAWCFHDTKTAAQRDVSRALLGVPTEVDIARGVELAKELGLTDAEYDRIDGHA